MLEHEPATPLFPGAHNFPQYDAKAVSPSYARKLASDSATALQVNIHPFFATLNDVSITRPAAWACPGGGGRIPNLPYLSVFSSTSDGLLKDRRAGPEWADTDTG